MTLKRNNGGFTLLELIISIAIGSMIMMAASTTLLLGLRINAASTTTIKQQNTTNMLVQIVESIADKGAVTIIKDTPEDADPIWYIKSGEQDKESAYLKFDNGILYLNGTKYMEEIDSFEAVTDDSNKLLTITIKTNGSTYTASKYCRLNTPTTEGD